MRGSCEAALRCHLHNHVGSSRQYNCKADGNSLRGLASSALLLDSRCVMEVCRRLHRDLVYLVHHHHEVVLMNVVLLGQRSVGRGRRQQAAQALAVAAAVVEAAEETLARELGCLMDAVPLVWHREWHRLHVERHCLRADLATRRLMDAAETSQRPLQYRQARLHCACALLWLKLAVALGEKSQEGA